MGSVGHTRKPSRGLFTCPAIAAAILLTLAAGEGLSLAPQPGQERRAQHLSVRQVRAERLVAEGEAALERDDGPTARGLFRRALEDDPRNVTAHTYLGILADRSGELGEAEQHFAAAARLAPNLPATRNNYGAILVRRGRTAAAAAEFEASLRLDPKQPSALVNLAQIRFASGEPEDLRRARELFARAQALAPDADVARALLVTSLRLGEKEAGEAAYREYVRLVGSAGAKSPDSAARTELGLALLEVGLTAEAVSELSAAAAADPSNVSAVVGLGRAHLARKDVPSSGRVLEAAVARGLDAAPVYAALAETYEAGGYVENAIPAMRLAIARDPENEAYLFRYGMLLTDTEAPAAAIIRLEEALKKIPRSSRLWLALGVAQLAHGKNSEAQSSFERALALEPKSVAALAYLGTTRLERGEYVEAAALYERAIAAEPRLAAPHYLAADALLKQAAPDAVRAENYLKRALELDPSLVPARMLLAKLYVRSERWDEAASLLERAVALDPELAEAHYQLGRVYVRLKRAEEAKRELDTFQRLSKAQKERRESDRRELLRRLAYVRF